MTLRRAPYKGPITRAELFGSVNIYDFAFCFFFVTLAKISLFSHKESAERATFIMTIIVGMS